ncbi:hypothetical protein PM082_015461 [Marasmius tenuissimus]|nr:hypothetical protein PM082_015461 [Marasmius tenuissimus]
MYSIAFWVQAFLTLGGTFSAAQFTGPTIQGNGVTYQGAQNASGNTDYFLSIPFAQPPVGNQRFKPPVAWSPSGPDTVIDATTYGPNCPQGVAGDDSDTSEDCLTLHIWKPSNVTENLPVMVWIYGGGFYFGTTRTYEGWSIVQPSIMINKPVIYVAMNYRTGIFGFPPGTASAKAGALNLGLKDQRLALEWVQENIEYFGGDKTKVTLFGQSAGAISAAYQSMYKGGDVGGVFRGIIMESGSPSSVNVPPADDPVQEKAYQFVVNATGCTDFSDTFECLRSVPSDVLQKANKDVVQIPPEWRGPDQGPVVLGPVLAPGDDFLPELPSISIHAGRYAKLPLINGGVKDEGTISTNTMTPETEKNVTDWLLSQEPGLYFGISNETAVAELLKLYPADPAAGSPYGTGSETFGLAAQYKRLASLVGDLIFEASRRDHVQTATTDGVDVWSYFLNASIIQLDSSLDFFGVQHTAEYTFVFHRLTEDTSGATIPDYFAKVEDVVFNYWINFAYNLDPNPTSGSYPYWPKYGSNATLISLGEEISLIPDTHRAEGIEYIINTPSLYN